MPCTKFVVPSSGSTIHRRPDEPAGIDSFSSPIKPWSGKVSRIMSRTARCEATSASVTRSAGLFLARLYATGIVAKDLAADASRTFAQLAELVDKGCFPHECLPGPWLRDEL